MNRRRLKWQECENFQYAKLQDLHPICIVLFVTVLVVNILLVILVVYFATKPDASPCNNVIHMNSTVFSQVSLPEYKSDKTSLQLEVWENNVEVTISPGNFSLHKVNYLGSGQTMTVCTQGLHNYSISCSANGQLDCKAIPEDNQQPSLFVGAKNMWTKYYIDIKCTNKKAGLKWT